MPTALCIKAYSQIENIIDLAGVFIRKNSDMATIQILNREVLSDKKYILQNITYSKPDLEGNMQQQQNEVYFRPDAVAVLLADKKKQTFLFTHQFRLPAFLNGNEKGFLLETCAGLIDEGETPEQAARREADEETGYQIANLERIAGVYTSAGGVTEYIYLFTADYDSEGPHGKGGGKPGEQEDIELIEMSFTEARDKLKLSAFNDAKTIILLQHFFLNNLE
jgi:GDP-mannose pyrophosphatase NudK